MECPLCEHTGLDASFKNCPSCNADLTTYHALDTIEASLKKQRKTTMLLIILFIVALMACVAIFFLMNRGDTPPVDDEKLANCEATVKDLQAKNQQLNNKVAEMESTIASVQVKEEEKAVPAKITHVIGEGETLYIIAKKYLGDGNLYPKIASDNGIEDANLIEAGGELIIYK